MSDQRWTMNDVKSLRRAAAIVRGRSTKPKGLLVSVFCRVLLDQATKIEAEERPTDRVGSTWLVSELPCPRCGKYTVIGYLLVDEDGEHMHTYYACTFWPSARKAGLDPALSTRRCGWEGWSVPGWDRD